MSFKVLLVALVLIVLGFATSYAQLPELSFKGLRIGMPLIEFQDSVRSSTFFLRKINYITDYFGESQRRMDSLTAEITSYDKVGVGCVTEYSISSCPTFGVTNVSMKANRVVGMTLYAFDATFIVTTQVSPGTELCRELFDRSC